MVNKRYEKKHPVQSAVEGADDIWLAAAARDGAAAMMTYYNDDDNAEPYKEVKVTFKNVKSAHGVRLEYYIHGKDNDCELIREEIFTAEEFSAYVKIPLNSTYLFKIEEI